MSSINWLPFAMSHIFLVPPGDTLAKYYQNIVSIMNVTLGRLFLVAMLLVDLRFLIAGKRKTLNYWTILNITKNSFRQLENRETIASSFAKRL